jgi:hypothetical protein
MMILSSIASGCHLQSLLQLTSIFKFLKPGMGPPRPMQAAAGLAVCCGLLQTAAARIFDKYFDHMNGPGCQHSKMAASSSGGAAAGSQAAVMAQAQQREYPDFKEYFVTKPSLSLREKHCRAEFLHSPLNLQRNKGQPTCRAMCFGAPRWPHPSLKASLGCHPFFIEVQELILNCHDSVERNSNITRKSTRKSYSNNFQSIFHVVFPRIVTIDDGSEVPNLYVALGVLIDVKTSQWQPFDLESSFHPWNRNYRMLWPQDIQHSLVRAVRNSLSSEWSLAVNLMK